MQQEQLPWAEIITTAVGYFAFMYLLQLFPMYSDRALNGLIYSEPDRDAIAYWQYYGLLAGGLFWGLLSDIKGRTQALFMAVMVYAFGSAINGYVTSVNGYKMARFITTFGLAGELGAGFALIFEATKHKARGHLAGLICAVGFLGPLLVFFLLSEKTITMRTALLGNLWEKPDLSNAYFVGSGLGLLVLLLRVSVEESKPFLRYKRQFITPFPIISSLKNITTSIIREKHTFIFILLAGLQTALVNGILLPSLTQDSSFDRPFLTTIFFFSQIFAVIFSGLLSDYWNSRKRALHLFQWMFLGGLVLFFIPIASTEQTVIWRTAMLGWVNGFWPLYVLLCIEHFGINCRSTATSLLLNLSRAVAVAYNYLFVTRFDTANYLMEPWKAMIAGLLVFIIAMWSVEKLEETAERAID